MHLGTVGASATTIEVAPRMQVLLQPWTVSCSTATREPPYTKTVNTSRNDRNDLGPEVRRELRVHEATVAATILIGAIIQLPLRDGHQAVSGHYPRALDSTSRSTCGVEHGARDPGAAVAPLAVVPVVEVNEQLRETDGGH